MSTKTTPKKGKRRRKPSANRETWKAKFIEAMRVCGVVRYAAVQAGVDRTHAYLARKKDPKFKEAWDNAREDAIDSLEVSCWKRARDGVQRVRQIFHKGQAIGQDVFIDYPDTLCMFLLKAARPEKYREQHAVQVTGDSANPLVVQRAELTREQEDELIGAVKTYALNDERFRTGNGRGNGNGKAKRNGGNGQRTIKG